MTRILQSAITKLDNLFSLTESVDNDEVKSNMSRFLCVRTSGLMETFVKEKVSEYVSGTSPIPIQNYMVSAVKSITNLDSERIEKFLGQFSAKWKEEFISGITEEQKESLNSVIGLRHQIAHGHNDSISFHTMKAHYQNIKKVITVLDSIVSK